jgi:hypothetical protein
VVLLDDGEGLVAAARAPGGRGSATVRWMQLLTTARSRGPADAPASARQWHRAPLDLAKTKGMVRSGRSRAFQRAWSREKRGHGDGNLYRAPERSSSKIELSPARESQGRRLRFGVVFLVS